ncbi:MAG TPA: HigA family addiction module antitoxin [Byssovorax sp.]
MAAQPIRYDPDYAVHPGEVLDEYLAAAGMTQAELAARLGRPLKTVSEIIHGKAAITPETALQLERVFGRPAALWQNLEASYRRRLAVEQERGSLADHRGWAKRFPVKALLEGGHVESPKDDADLVDKLLRFFGVGTVAGWELRFGSVDVAYRRSPSFEAAPESVAAWIRLGEIGAAEIECQPFDKKAFRAALEEARRLTTKRVPVAIDELRTLCASAGVAFVVVPELPKTHLSGIARWVSKDKALIQLSLRHKTDDHFWFSFFHEAGHILLHSKKTLFIDEKGGDDSAIEREANRFAEDLLLSAAAYARFVAARDFSEGSVERFAKAQGVAVGIVVGRLQHQGHVPFTRLNHLKAEVASAAAPARAAKATKAPGSKRPAVSRQRRR